MFKLTLRVYAQEVETSCGNWNCIQIQMIMFNYWIQHQRNSNHAIVEFRIAEWDLVALDMIVFDARLKLILNFALTPLAKLQTLILFQIVEQTLEQWRKRHLLSECWKN